MVLTHKYEHYSLCPLFNYVSDFKNSIFFTIVLTVKLPTKVFNGKTKLKFHYITPQLKILDVRCSCGPIKKAIAQRFQL